MLLSTAAFSYAYDLVIIILQQQWALEKIKQLKFFSILIPVKLLKIRELNDSIGITSDINCRGYQYSAAHIEIIVKLELNDMVYVRKRYDEATSHMSRNYFAGWWMP